MKYSNFHEEEIKNKVTMDFFDKFDCTKILGKIDFAVKLKRPANDIDFNDEYLLWAEAKQKKTDIIATLAQLVLTIGKARTFDKIMPPKFIGCFDSEKIAFVPYHDTFRIFSIKMILIDKSDDDNYNELINALRDTLKVLAKKIEPKVYEYEFLKK